VRSADNPTGSTKVRGKAVKLVYSSREVIPIPRVSRHKALEAPELSSRQTASLNRELQTKGLDLVAIFKYI
jgi:hypothetical protein